VTRRNLAGLSLYAGATAALWALMPQAVRAHAGMRLFVAVGALGAWRYSWWLLHLVRAMLYRSRVYPGLRAAAARAWDAGWRPRRLHILVSSYHERPETSRRVIRALIDECLGAGVRARVFLGGATPDEEVAIAADFAAHLPSDAIELVLVSSGQPGKRRAMGLVLRAMRSAGVHPDDPVVFMDGDSVVRPGALRRCLPLLAIRPDVDALTTHEEAEVDGSRCFQAWMDVRFAQRHLMMHSHALSEKVLTLTGRFSIFRASAAVTGEMIEAIESDHLDHWLWGSVPLLSGDDKSTWYTLVKRPGGARMLYVPDAVVATLETVEHGGLSRMSQNLMRWSGNSLHNGGRALALGPRQLGGFIWWCLLDQRLAIFTSLLGLAALGSHLAVGDLGFAWLYLTWVLSTRFLYSLPLQLIGGRVSAAWPLVIYLNQVASAVLKLFVLFHPGRQRWVNRGNQNRDVAQAPWRRALSLYLVGLHAAGVVVIMHILEGLR
jgi:mannuronan synthase